MRFIPNSLTVTKGSFITYMVFLFVQKKGQFPKGRREEANIELTRHEGHFLLHFLDDRSGRTSEMCQRSTGSNVEVESNWTEQISNRFLSNFSNYFWPFKIRINRITNFWIKSKIFRMNPISENLTPPYNWSCIEQIEFKLIFIKFFEYFFPFWINRIANFPIERILNEFRTKF